MRHKYVSLSVTALMALGGGALAQSGSQNPQQAQQTPSASSGVCTSMMAMGSNTLTGGNQIGNGTTPQTTGAGSASPGSGSAQSSGSGGQTPPAPSETANPAQGGSAQSGQSGQGSSLSGGNSMPSGQSNTQGGQAAPGQTGNTQNQSPANTNPGNTSTVPSPEAMVMQAVANSNCFEIESSQAALQKGATGNLGSFTRRMISDHTRAQQQLRQLAQKKGFAVPNNAGTANTLVLMNASRLSGTRFQQAYINAQVAGHGDTIKFLQEAGRSSDADVKAWAQATLKAVQTHLDMAKKLAPGK